MSSTRRRYSGTCWTRPGSTYAPWPNGVAGPLPAQGQSQAAMSGTPPFVAVIGVGDKGAGAGVAADTGVGVGPAAPARFHQPTHSSAIPRATMAPRAKRLMNDRFTVLVLE